MVYAAGAVRSARLTKLVISLQKSGIQPMFIGQNIGGGDRMSDILSGVKCTVKNCKFNEKGRLCTASAIEVNVDDGGDAAKQSRETNCRTFQPEM